jgi:hypothetical protein
MAGPETGSCEETKALNLRGTLKGRMTLEGAG